MNEKMQASIDVGKNLTELLEKLATQIGVTADKIFPWYVKQSVIEGWLYVAFWITGVSVALIMLIVSLRKLKFDEIGNPNRRLIGRVCGGVIAVICFISLIVAPERISGILNPEYNAMSRLLGQLGNLK